MYSVASHGLMGVHSRSLGLSPQVPAGKDPLPPAVTDAYANQAVQAAAGGEAEVGIGVVQMALAAHFGTAAMRHSCSSTGCDGRWGPGTERLVDQVFALLDMPDSATFAVNQSRVMLPGPVAAWMYSKAANYRAQATSTAPPSLEEAMVPDPVEEPYSSPRRRSGATVWLVVGGVTAAVGVGALGFVLWKKRKGRR